MSEPFSGGCACGQIRYRCISEPRYMGNCHCRDCQRATGSAYAPVLLFKVDDFALVSGEPSWYEKPADRGHTMRRGFCPACGSPVLLINDAAAGFRLVYASSLDDPERYQPARDIFVASAQAWDVMHPHLPKHDAMMG